VGKAGFITALYIIMVPIMGILWHRKPKPRVWWSVGLAAVGIYLLCMNDAFIVNPGDVYVFGCAIAFTGHILVIDHFSAKADGVAMSCIQFFVCALLCGAAMLLVETPTWENIYAARLPLLYAGILSSGVGYTLQIIGQKDTEPVVASLLMSLESVFAALGGWLILGQRLTERELLGCGIVFGAIVLIQLPEAQSKGKRSDPEIRAGN
jgi:drug/metabolite transporter (DMT)-like permease